MPKLIVSIDGVVIKEVELIKERTTLGRRPYNDVVIDNLAVSGEHAVMHLNGTQAEVEDLGSTNGTYVNGKAVKRQALRHNDAIEVGKYKIRFVQEEEDGGYEKTMVFKPGMVPPLAPRPQPAPAVAPVASAPWAAAAPGPAQAAAPLPAVIRVLSGAAAGREVVLTKVVTTIGKPGVAVASITRRHHGYVLAHVEGPNTPLHNGVHIGEAPVPLHSGDTLELAGTAMQFIQH